MSKETKESDKKIEYVRVSKENRKNLKGQTYWASLIVEERKEKSKS